MDIFNKLDMGNRIRLLREATGHTQNDLAEILGQKRQVISYYESGVRTPNLKQLILIAKTYNTTTDYLLGLSDTSTNDVMIKQICDYTGLSVENINRLNQLCDDIASSNHKTFLNEIVNYVYNARFYIPNYIFHRNNLIVAYKEDDFNDTVQLNIEQNLFVSQYKLQSMFNDVLNDTELSSAIEWYNKHQKLELNANETMEKQLYEFDNYLRSNNIANTHIDFFGNRANGEYSYSETLKLLNQLVIDSNVDFVEETIRYLSRTLKDYYRTDDDIMDDLLF